MFPEKAANYTHGSGFGMRTCAEAAKIAAVKMRSTTRVFKDRKKNLS